MNTTLDLLEAATLSLTRSAPIKDRVADAYRNYLSRLDGNDLPADIREELRALTDHLTRVPPQLRGDDALRATIRKMSNDDAAEVASAVVRLFGAVSRASVQIERSDSATAQKQVVNVVPLHIAAG